ncbi:phage integrase Arm DNA-binding domain-containing protein [Pseudomonas fluorescens]|uniref:phage integrase Arm DNA-binding domain-containing protein n=1 Tax=Pseudomonas fluorescens TaxID=294 RepID=UPI0032565CC3
MNKGLPQNLYFDKRRLSYPYRRPTDGKWFQFGKDRLKAIDAAMQLNLTFMHGADLISNVMAKSPEESETFSAFLALYEDVLLPPRGLAKATLCMYRVHFRRYRKAFEGKRVDEITIRMVAELLDSLPPRSSNQCRNILVDIFNHAASKGLCPDNPATVVIKRIEKKQRKRHTAEGLRAIREVSPVWLQNAIDIALITAQRRNDILDMAFQAARKEAGCYAGWSDAELPGFHEIRAFSLHLYKKAGKDGQKIAGHASSGMTKNYQKDHDEIIWSEANPDLDISEISGKF